MALTSEKILAELQTQLDRQTAPASAKQRALLLKLGYVGNLDDLTIGEASNQIADLLEQQKAQNAAAIEQAKRIAEGINLADVAGRRVALGKESAKEWSGPCPKCGGRDRFHVTEHSFFCRKCHPEWGDYIEYLVWTDNKDFLSVCIDLAGGTVPTSAGPVQRLQAAHKEPQPATWNPVKADDTVRNAAHILISKHGIEGRKYLTGRGLNPSTWEAFGLGYKREVLLPGTWDDETKTRSHPPQPAIVIPWIVAGELRAIRYRFIEKHNYIGIDGKEHKDVKSKSEYGGPTAGLLFGEQTHEPGATALILCEGELNACSIWQVTREMGVNVLSLGSQDAKLTPAHIEQIARYPYVLAWLDERERAKAIMSALPGAHGMQSPRGMDANDLLQAGKLQALITGKLQRDGWTPPGPPQAPETVIEFERHHWPSVELARTGDRTFFVGLDVSDEVWGILQERANGWVYDARPIAGGVHIERFRTVGWTPPHL